MTRRPFFTIITATYNCANVLDGAIDSVLSQSRDDVEYIIIDGGSTDGTVDLIRKHAQHLAYWISEPDAGVYDAWNKALAVARGDWLSFLGGDDRLKPGALDAYAAFIPSVPEVEYVSSRVELTSDGIAQRTIGRPWSWPAFSRYLTTAHVGAQHHRRLFDSVGPFNIKYKICGDYELLLRKRGQLKAAFLDAVTAEMGEGGMSTALVGLALRETELAKREAGGRNALLCKLERYDGWIRYGVRRAL